MEPPVPRLRDETIELQQKLFRVQSLLEAARRIHATIRLDDVLSSVLETAAKELEAEGAFFFSANGSFDARVNTFGRVPDDWTRWSERRPLPGYSSAPLLNERGEPFAHLVICRPQALSMEEEDFLEGLALQSALAVSNAQHHERMLEWERVQLDLGAARAIQRSLLPQSIPEVPGYSLVFRATTCYEVGGDYVDVRPLPDGRLMIVLADVAGKGLASALVSASFRASFRAMVGAGLPIEEMASRLNDLHWQEGQEARRRYVTAILACLDPRMHTVEFVNAGHNPAFVTGTPEGEPVRVGASGPPLGLLPEQQYQCERWSLSDNSRLLLYTDGLTEVFRGDEEFGEDRLLGLLCEQPNRPDFLDYVWKSLGRFSGNARQTDDMTALYLYRAAEGGAQ